MKYSSSTSLFTSAANSGVVALLVVLGEGVVSVTNIGGQRGLKEF